MSMDKQFTLLELNKAIQEQIYSGFPDSIWLIGEISELKVNRNGHCYLELIEKDAITDNIIARTRATIWAFTYRMLRPYFESVTGHELIPGIKLLVKAKVEYHELYGLSLNISDVDPNYTLGDLAQKKAEIIKRLEEDGVMNLNKELNFPLVPQRIAIISSETAAGYQDFMNQLENNSYSYIFYTKLFSSIMQGTQAEETIINSLEKIFEHEELFDVVVIIRGGGSQADLSCFDSYLLAANIAQFPLPVLTGIGHDKDESVADLVAFKKLKTPTAVAEYIIERANNFEESIINSRNQVIECIQDKIQNLKTRLTSLTSVIIPSVRNNLNNQNYKLELINEKLKNNISIYLKDQNNFFNISGKKLKHQSNYLILRNIERIKSYKKGLKSSSSFRLRNETLLLKNSIKRLDLLNPKNILKRGYSITYHNGNVLKDLNKLNLEDEITTKLLNGSIRSKICEKHKNQIK